MKKKTGRKLGIGLLVALILIGMFIAAAIVFIFPQRARAVFSRPLVLIHSPVQHDQIDVEQSAVIHATARNQKGVTRMELWVDGELVDEREAPGGEPANPLVLNSDWQPATTGKHMLLVRALSPDDVSGQATIEIEAVEAEPILEDYTVEEGDTLETIADEHGISPEELSELNPDMASAEPAPGDTLDVPAGGGTGEAGGSGEASASGEDAESEEAAEPDDAGAEEPPGDEPASPDGAPDLDFSPPGASLDLLEFFQGLDLSELFDTGSRLPQMLYMEILAFETGRRYEDTNCYVSLAGGPWDISELEGASEYFAWPDDQPLSLDIECAGITMGGTDSVDLGRLAMRIPSEHWDGVTRSAASISGDFRVEYRVSNSDDFGLEPRWLDEEMTPPTNLFLDERRHGLSWGYYPEPDEDPINGFAVYLNGNLQWTERYRDQFRFVSDLPPEWLRPPCGEQYIFTVTAFGPGFPDGPESRPAAPPVIIDTPEDECEVEVMVTFYDLITHELGGDGDADDRTGDLGPVHGHFFVNDQQETFDTGSLGRGLDQAVGITHNTTYDLFEFAARESRSWISYPTFITEVPMNETLVLGFHMMDEDSGRCNWSGDPDCDDLVCEVENFYQHSNIGDLYSVHESRMMSDNRRCEVTYRVEPTGDTPIGVPGGYTPAPFLWVENLSVDEASGNLLVEVRNQGTATWANHDLWVDLIRGEEVNQWILAQNFRLEPGDTRVLDTGRAYRRPMDVCVVLDSRNNIQESAEISGAMDARRPYCPNLPDLEITDVAFEEESEQLQVTIRNNGEGTLENRTLEASIPFHAGELTQEWDNVTLAPRDTTVLGFPGIDPETRMSLTRGDGYTITIDPDDFLAEEDEDNNQYHVEGSQRYWISWQNGCSDYFERWRINHVYMYLTADIVSAGGSRRVADWAAPEIEMRIPDGGYRESHQGCWGSSYHGGWPAEFHTEQFTLAGDEHLVFHAWARLEAGAREWNIGDFEWEFRNPEERAYPDPTYPLCEAEPGHQGYIRNGTYFSGADESGEWYSIIKICRLEN